MGGRVRARGDVRAGSGGAAEEAGERGEEGVMRPVKVQQVGQDDGVEAVVPGRKQRPACEREDRVEKTAG